jgi:hypothetical protein
MLHHDADLAVLGETTYSYRERERVCKTLERILKLSCFCFCLILFFWASYEKELMQQWRFCINHLGFVWFFFIWVEFLCRIKQIWGGECRQINGARELVASSHPQVSEGKIKSPSSSLFLLLG